MPYKKIDWMMRYAQRLDISTNLIHLTRKTDEMAAIDVLIKILKDQVLIGSTQSTGFIIGDIPAVCFQDTPVYSVSQNLLHQKLNSELVGNRYSPYGLVFDKLEVYKCGGRPVIYERKEIAKNFLPPGDWWRIVSFDLRDTENMIDWIPVGRSVPFRFVIANNKRTTLSNLRCNVLIFFSFCFFFFSLLASN